MNKKLGPGSLLILSLALLYTGGAVEGALGVGLGVGGLVCLVLGIAGGIKKLFKGGDSIEKRTRSTARAILSSFLLVRSECNYPIESPSDKIRIYTHILKIRGYNDDDAVKGLIHEAKKISEVRDSVKGISLNTLVHVLVSHEYTKDTHKELTESQLAIVDRILSQIYRA